MSFFDAALVYDPATRRCDLALGADGDLVVDDTAITPMLLSIGLDRRAAEDDPLPAGRSAFLDNSAFSERRGWAGDALDPVGDRVGSRLWLLDRAKATETTLLLFRFWLDEALEWANRETGLPADIDVRWLARQTLGYRISLNEDSILLTRSTAP